MCERVVVDCSHGNSRKVHSNQVLRPDPHHTRTARPTARGAAKAQLVGGAA